MEGYIIERLEREHGNRDKKNRNLDYLCTEICRYEKKAVTLRTFRKEGFLSIDN